MREVGMMENFKWRWSHVDESGRAEQYATLLDLSRSGDDPAHFSDLLAWIDAQPGERVLEVGCGTGATAVAVARAVPMIHELVAIDASTVMIDSAKRRMAGRDLSVAFQVTDAHHLPFPEGAFDRCYATEVFVILPDPHQVLMEMARVTRPGGRICIRENDVDTLALLGPNLNLSRRLTRFVGDHLYNGAVGRQLIEWCKNLGWQVHTVPSVGISYDGALFEATILREWLIDAQRAGVMTQEEVDRFLTDIQDRQKAGRFFFYCVNFQITAVKMT